MCTIMWLIYMYIKKHRGISSIVHGLIKTRHVRALSLSITSAAWVFIISLSINSPPWAHFLRVIVLVTFETGGSVCHSTHWAVGVSTHTCEGAHSHTFLLSNLTGSLELITSSTPCLGWLVVRATLEPSTHRVLLVGGRTGGTFKLSPVPLVGHCPDKGSLYTLYS